MIDPSSFLTEHVTPGMTVLVLGGVQPAICERLLAAIGPTGLLVVGNPAPQRDCPGAARVRVLVTASGVLSHAADAVLLGNVENADLDLLAEECRRVLASRGALRAVVPAATAERLAAELRAAALRDVTLLDLAGMTGIRARGPS